MRTVVNPQQRLYSLDALRGFDMFWIMGAEDIFHSLSKATGSSFIGAIANQFTHPDWNGFHFYDLIFPLFLFMAGVATPYSVGRELENGKSKNQVLLRVIRRGLVLVLLGIIYNNGLQIRPLEEIRFPSVLGRIGLAYMFANIIYLFTKQRAQVIWFCSLLIGYWLFLKFTSAPGMPGSGSSPRSSVSLAKPYSAVRFARQRAGSTRRATGKFSPEAFAATASETSAATAMPGAGVSASGAATSSSRPPVPARPVVPASHPSISPQVRSNCKQ